MQRVEELSRADGRITIDSVATALGCSHGLAYSIMHDWGRRGIQDVGGIARRKKRPLGRPRRRCVNNINMDFREIG
jgi:hypothetical protein